MEKIIESIHNAIKKHWFWSIFLGKLSGIWFALIVTYFGKDWGLTVIDSDSKVTLSTLGIILSLVLFFVNLAIAGIEKYHEEHNDEKKLLDKISAERDLLKTISASLNDVCKIKIESQLQQIEKITEGKIVADHVFTQPCNQIKNISMELVKNLAFLTSEKSYQHDVSDFKISVAYNFPDIDDKHWSIADSFLGTGLDSKVLLDPSSTLNYLLSSNENLVYFNSKQEAYEKHHYVPSNSDVRDSDGKLKGSIACFLIEYASKNHVYIKAVLTISTQKRRIVDDNKYYKKGKIDEEMYRSACDCIYDNIDENIVKYYQYRLGVELCNFYVQYLYNKQVNVQIKPCLAEGQ